MKKIYNMTLFQNYIIIKKTLREFFLKCVSYNWINLHLRHHIPPPYRQKDGIFFLSTTIARVCEVSVSFHSDLRLQMFGEGRRGS